MQQGHGESTRGTAGWRRTCGAWLGVVLLGALAAGCSHERKLDVVNASGAPITQVSASGEGYRVALGTIEAGTTGSVPLGAVSGHAGLKLEFDAAGGRVSESLPQNCLDGFKQVTVTVSPDHKVGFTSGITTF